MVVLMPHDLSLTKIFQFLVLLKVGTGRPKVLTDLVLRTIGVLFTFMV